MEGAVVVCTGLLGNAIIRGAVLLCVSVLHEHRTSPDAVEDQALQTELKDCQSGRSKISHMFRWPVGIRPDGQMALARLPLLLVGPASPLRMQGTQHLCDGPSLLRADEVAPDGDGETCIKPDTRLTE